MTRRLCDDLALRETDPSSSFPSTDDFPRCRSLQWCCCGGISATFLGESLRVCRMDRGLTFCDPDIGLGRVGSVMLPESTIYRIFFKFITATISTLQRRSSRSQNALAEETRLSRAHIYTGMYSQGFWSHAALKNLLSEATPGAGGRRWPKTQWAPSRWPVDANPGRRSCRQCWFLGPLLVLRCYWQAPLFRWVAPGT